MSNGKKFAAIPRHALDLHAQRDIARKLNALCNGQIKDATGKTIGEIHYADGNTVFEISVSSSGGAVNEYNPDRPYVAGEMFKVSRVLVQDSQTIPKGIWAVPIAETDTNGETWTGLLPANPTGAQVPQETWVSGACASLWVKDCS